MASLDNELRTDAENDAQEAEYIRHTLSAELQERYTTEDILAIMDLIVEYYFDSGILESDDNEVEIDLQQVAEGVAASAKKQLGADYPAEDIFFMVQADLDWQEQQL